MKQMHTEQQKMILINYTSSSGLIYKLCKELKKKNKENKVTHDPDLKMECRPKERILKM